MSRSSSERESYAGRKQIGREFVETGVARGKIHRAAPIVLSDVLISQVGVPVRVECYPRPDRELVPRGLGEQRRHKLWWRSGRVVQVAAAQLQLRVVLVLGAETETVRVLARRMQRQVGR